MENIMLIITFFIRQVGRVLVFLLNFEIQPGVTFLDFTIFFIIVVAIIKILSDLEIFGKRKEE